MNGIAAAFGATGLYYLGFAVFKLAADRMEPLRGHRIIHLAWTILTNWVFLAGLALVLGGLGLQIVALADLSLGIAVPIFMSGIIPLVIISLAFFGDRLTGREWLSLLLIAVAIGLITASVGTPPPYSSVEVPLWKVAVVVLPPVVVSLLILVSGDYRPDGRHARPVTGIAYGLSSGFPIGTAELAIKGWADSGADGLGILTTFWPYVTVLSAALGFGVLVIAFQRCRVAIVATVMTVSAKTYLLLMGTYMYGEPWPESPLSYAMRLGGLIVGALAVVLFPRHRPLEGDEAADHEEVPAAQDPFGGPAPARRAPLTRRPGHGGGVPRPAVAPLSAPTPHDAPGQSAPPQPPHPRQPPQQGGPPHEAPHEAPPAPPSQPSPYDALSPFDSGPYDSGPYDSGSYDSGSYDSGSYGSGPYDPRGGPDERPPASGPSGHLAPDRDTGPYALGPYAGDPLGRGPYREEQTQPHTWSEDDWAEQEQRRRGGRPPR